MKNLIIAAMGIVFSGVALAGGIDNFAPNTGCFGTACTPYTNDNPDITVSYVARSTYWTNINLTVNGVVYSMPFAPTSVVVTYSNPYVCGLRYRANYSYTNVIAVAVDGSVITVNDLEATFSRSIVCSGHNYYRSTWTVVGGTITTP